MNIPENMGQVVFSTAFSIYASVMLIIAMKKEKRANEIMRKAIEKEIEIYKKLSGDQT